MVGGTPEDDRSSTPEVHVACRVPEGGGKEEGVDMKVRRQAGGRFQRLHIIEKKKGRKRGVVQRIITPRWRQREGATVVRTRRRISEHWRRRKPAGRRQSSRMREQNPGLWKRAQFRQPRVMGGEKKRGRFILGPLRDPPRVILLDSRCQLGLQRKVIAAEKGEGKKKERGPC